MASDQGLFAAEYPPDLTFVQARKRVQFAVILMSRRLENPDDNLQNAFFSFDGKSFTFTPISDAYLATREGIIALSQDLVEQASRLKTKFGFLLVSVLVQDEYKVFLHGLSSIEEQIMEAGLLRRKFGNPILQHWSESTSAPWTLAIVAPLKEWLMMSRD